MESQGEWKLKEVNPMPVIEGLDINTVAVGARIEVHTKNRTYMLENCGDGQVLISGHPKYCPRPLLVKLLGCTWGGAMLKMQYIEPGMYLEYRHPLHGIVCTSRIEEVREIPPDTQPEQYRVAS